MWCAVDNHNYVCHICAKGFLNSNLSNYLQNTNFFTKLPQISHTHKNRSLKSIIKR